MAGILFALGGCNMAYQVNIGVMIIKTVAYAATQSLMQAFVNEPLRDQRYHQRVQSRQNGIQHKAWPSSYERRRSSSTSRPSWKDVPIETSMPWNTSDPVPEVNDDYYLSERERIQKDIFEKEF